MKGKTPLFINGNLKGECLTVKLSQDQDGYDTRYAYHVEDFVPVQPKLNENQQVVLDWLKDDFKESENPVDSLESLASEVLHVETFQTCISSTYDDLNISEQFQVLAAFAEWGMKEVAE